MLACDHEKFLEDKYCIECGLDVSPTESLRSLEQTFPEDIDAIKADFPKATFYTGRLDQVYLYKREYKSSSKYSNNDISYSYYWITLVLTNGEKYSCSIDAENESLNALKVGSVVTVAILAGSKLSFKLSKSSDKNIVTNDVMACAVMIHSSAKSIYVLNSQYTSITKQPVFICYVSAIVIAILLYSVFELSGIISLAVAAISFVFIFKKEADYSVDKYESNIERVGRLEAILKSLSRTNISTLGYDKLSRTRNRTDVICPSCHNRNDVNAKYCNQCGSEAVISHVEPESVNLEPELLTEFKSSPEQKTTLNSNSIEEIEQALFEQFSKGYEEDFVYKNLLSPNQKGNVSHKCYLYKVVGKQTKANVSEFSSSAEITSTTRYETRRVRDNAVVDTREETEQYTQTNNNRDSNVQGLITYKDGEGIKMFGAEDELLNRYEEGDWVFKAESTVSLNDKVKKYDFGEFNITKSQSFEKSDKDISFNWKNRFDSAIVSILFSLSIVATYFCYEHDISPLVVLFDIAASGLEFAIDLKSYTPIIVEMMSKPETSWMFSPFILIGLAGLLWIWEKVGNFSRQQKAKKAFRESRAEIRAIRQDIGDNIEELSERLKRIS